MKKSICTKCQHCGSYQIEIRERKRNLDGSETIDIVEHMHCHVHELRSNDNESLILKCSHFERDRNSRFLRFFDRVIKLCDWSVFIAAIVGCGLNVFGAVFFGLANLLGWMN